MKIAVYISGVPPKVKPGNEFKRNILTWFGEGAKICGDDVYLVTDYNTVLNVDVAVIQGWTNKTNYGHLKVRHNAIHGQLTKNRHVVILDANLFGFLSLNDFNKYLRYSLNGIFPTDAWYFNKDMDLARWGKIKKACRFEEVPWKTDGDHILICLQRNGGWSMHMKPVTEWLHETITKLRMYTDRKIIVRGHPGDVKELTKVNSRWLQTNWTNIEIRDPNDKTLRQELMNVWATITYNSSPGVASVLCGVPVFVTDPIPQKSQTFPLCNTRLEEIENPMIGDREEFYHRLAQCHWNCNEVKSGEAWAFMRERFPSKFPNLP